MDTPDEQAPWLKYQDASSGGKPWEKYGGSTAPDQPAQPGMMDRLLAAGKVGLESTPIGQAIAGSLEGFGYKPTSLAGQAVAAVSKIPERVGEYFGGKTAEKVTAMGGAPETAGVAGAAVKTGLSGAMMMLPTPAGKAKIAKEAVGEAANVARQYADRIGLDWGSLSSEFKSRLTSIAEKASDLEKLSPEAVKRQARAASFGVPITRGQAERGSAMLTEEELLRSTDAGSRLRELSARQDTALHDALRGVRQEVAPGSLIEASEDVGKPLQEAAARKLRVLQAQAGRNYRLADEAGETLAPVEISPLNEWLKKPTNKANAGALQSLLETYAKDGKTVTIRELEDIRQDLNREVASGTKAGHYAGEAVNVIDGILDNAGSSLYKTARQSWRLMKDEFTRQAAVRDLVSTKANVYDRKVALENTLDHVLRGSGEQLNDIKTTLLEGGTAKTREMGKKAWNDVRAGVIEKLREKAAGKRQIPGEAGQLSFNSEVLDLFASLDQGGKLETLFGAGPAKKLRSLMDTVRDVRTTPPARVSGSNSVNKLFKAFESFIDLPGMKLVSGPIKERVQVSKALKPSVEKAAERAEPSPTLKSLQEATRKRGPAIGAVTLSEMESNQ